MSKAVLISIQPQWCDLIANGLKTIEVRKTMPKLETPFKCYIYESSGNQRAGNENFNVWLKGKGRKKVIGEFVCDRVTKFSYDEKYDNITLIRMGVNACLTKTEIEDYANGEYFIYGWHISDLVIYDKSKELSEFNAICPNMMPDGTRKNGNCPCGKYTHDFDEITGKTYCTRRKTKPPQSWCYVESKSDNKKIQP